MKKITAGAVTLLCLIQFAYSAQQIPDSLRSTPVQFLNKINDCALGVLNNKYSLLNKLVERRAEKALQKMEKRELGLQRKLQAQLHGADSLRAVGLFAGTTERYRQLLTDLRAGIRCPTGLAGGSVVNPLKEYLPGVDSMQTALRFLSQPGLALPAETERIQGVSRQLQQLQGGLQNANDLQSYFSQREQQLKDQFGNNGIDKQLLGINQEAYYYQAQLAQYKGMINDPEKFQQAVLSAVRESPYFKSFWQKNSYWSALFPAQPDAGTPQALSGLQTRDQLQQDVQKRLGKSMSAVSDVAVSAGGSGGGGVGYLQNQMQNAQARLDALKAKLTQSGGGAAGNMTLPDFQPNSQHNKTFLKRLEYSFIIQNTASTSLLPAISTLGINIGYKLSEKAIVGVGGSYLLGLGNGLSNIRLSNQGIGYRTFADIRAKGSIWITGGLEYTYMQRFSGIQDIRNIDVWQKSALIGLTKKYRIGKRSGEIQLLYDLLASQEVPAGQAFKFRVGWSL